MKDLLEKHMSMLYDNKGTIHLMNEITVSGAFSLKDDKACGQCIPFFSGNCGHETFLIHSNSDIHCLDIEAFFDGFKNVLGDRCDRLLYDGRKCVLLDLYCGMSEYLDPHKKEKKVVTGKKEKARNQIEKTIERLCSVHDIEDYLNGMSEKVGVFGYRSKDEEMFKNIPKTLRQSEKAFLMPYIMQAERRLASPMSHGFIFLMHSYPKRYEW